MGPNRKRRARSTVRRRPVARAPRVLAAASPSDSRLPGFRESPAHFYDLIAAGYLLVDERGVINDVNRAGAKMIGRPRNAVQGELLRAFVSRPDRPALANHLRRCRSNPGVVETDLSLSAADGRILPVRLYSRRVRHATGTAFPTVAIDMTERLSNERARERAERERDAAYRERQLAQAAEAAKDHLIAVVSHELRNPLTPALIAAEGLSAWPALPEQARHLASVIRRNIEIEARLIDDLIDVARIRRGHLRLQVAPTDIHELLAEVVATVRPAAAEKCVSVAFHAGAANHQVNADAGRLRQVFWNLLNNAVKFTEPHGCIFVDAIDAGGRLRVSVRDDGVGMDADTLRGLFRSFNQSGAGGARAGLGLGLSIAREIVEAHGGHITADSPGPGCGSRFEVELETLPPQDRPSLGHSRHPARAAQAAGRQPRALGRVLIVEDDGDASEILSLFLRERGYDPTRVSSLAHALGALQETWYAIVADIGLGDGSGLEIAREARRLPKPPERLVAVSGYGSPKDLQASRAAGFDTHLVKPMDFNRLLAALSPANARKGHRQAG